MFPACRESQTISQTAEKEPATAESAAPAEDGQLSAYEARMEAQEEDSALAAPKPTLMAREAPAKLVGQVSATDLSLDEVLWLQLPDPSVAEETFKKRLESTRFSANIQREYDLIFKETLGLINEISRPVQFPLTLADALRRALENNYLIEIEGFAPAISAAQVVQAEAAFDTAFFASANRNNTDQPTPSALFATQTDTTIVAGGIRKMLASGATVTLNEQMTRIDNPGFAFQTLNPAWTHDFVAELRQPTLRGFGTDFNRAEINIRSYERKISEEAFRARVIEILSGVEQAYLQLMAARRDVVVSAELLAQARRTYDQVKARADFDAYQTLLYQSEATVKQREFEYIDVKNRVRNAEDQLLNLLNDSELPLSADLEVIPNDDPISVEVVRDEHEVIKVALQRRPEILQARYRVDSARIQLGAAKNQALPQLDLVYRMTLNGLGATSDSAFDQMTTSNFIDQFVGFEFQWNFGERAERSGIRIAALQQSQAVATYKKSLDDVITDCRVTLRDMRRNYEQIAPSYQGVIASAESLRSIQERQERKSPAELDAVLARQTALATSRRALLESLLRYNLGIVELERAKGTLLEYNNVVMKEHE